MKFIAENLNIMSRSLGPAMRNREAGPLEDCAKLLKANGADILDLNIGPARKQGDEMMAWVVQTVQGAVDDLPLALDSTNPIAIEGGLKVYNSANSRPIINSISAITDTMAKMIPMSLEYNAQFVALMYAKEGIPRDANERAILAADMLYQASEHGVPMEDMYFDPIAVPVASQQTQVPACTEFTMMIPDMAPGAESTCGLSNISNGAPEELRDIINQTYIIILKNFGMTSAILDGFDKEIMAIAHDEKQEWEEFVMKVYNGEVVDLAGLDKKYVDFYKTVKILTGDALYSDSWLEL